ncbi:pinin protein [Dioscorea alata]|uniref:Pinin protein n=1 Tax=Dioscorea alata TaxID=55571 RepID=A0ACB7U619_DIOAL|nr:pinin protein [Dioscorea alata]
MATASAEKTEEELRKEIEELNRQQREISERLRDPRGLRRGGGARGSGPLRQRGLVRPAVDEQEDQPSAKRRLSSAIVKVEDGEIKEDVGVGDGVQDAGRADVSVIPSIAEERLVNPQGNGRFRRGTDLRMGRTEIDDQIKEPAPRVFPKNEDPSLVKRNRRMLGQLLGTLEKFREEDKKLSTTEAYMRRSDSLKRAEEKAREESERLRHQEREQIAEKRRRDLTLRARVAAKAEEKKLELLFLHWSEHHKKLCNFLRTKAPPAIYYMPVKPLTEDEVVHEKLNEEYFMEWKSARRAELSEYQKTIAEEYLAKVDADLERWQNARNAKKVNNLASLQETMDKELETHRLEHGPKKRRIPGSNDEEEDVEDIAVEDELMDEDLEAHERIESESSKLPDTGNGSPGNAEML